MSRRRLKKYEVKLTKKQRLNIKKAHNSLIDAHNILNFGLHITKIMLKAIDKGYNDTQRNTYEKGIDMNMPMQLRDNVWRNI